HQRHQENDQGVRRVLALGCLFRRLDDFTVFVLGDHVSSLRMNGGDTSLQRSAGWLRSVSLRNERSNPLWCWSSLTRQLRTSLILTMPIIRPWSCTGMCRMLWASIFDATSATSSSGEHLITALVIRADTGKAWRSPWCKASP